MSSQSIKERKVKHNELSNDLNINNRQKPVDLRTNKQIAPCSHLPFGTILSLSGHIGTE